jgi:glycosyltransferase involved in cell wall biosynthesis
VKILLAHNAYRQAGGEETVVAAEHALLEQYGHQVDLFTASNNAVDGLPSQIATALRVSYSPEFRSSLARRLSDDRPDVVHVHNFFPLLTPSLYDACSAAGVPVVQTLHNYRLICPAATLLRDGKTCEICVTASAYRSVLHGCYRGSRLGTFAVARMVERHRKEGTWRHKVDRFIALTDFAKRKFIEGGIPADRIVVKPNFVTDPSGNDASPRPLHDAGALFVGRLSPEKGLRTLIDAWHGLDIPLRIAGDGPLRDAVNGAASNAVSVLGSVSPAAISDEMRRAAFLVVPSEWYEGFPMVIAEAYSRGLPVIASRIGSLAEIVENGVTGLHFAPGDSRDLAAKVRWAASSRGELRRLGEGARRRYAERYTPGANHATLVAIYQDAVNSLI